MRTIRNLGFCFFLLAIGSHAQSKWTWRNPSSPLPLRDIVWAGDKLVAVGLKSIMTSPDGLVWSDRSTEAEYKIHFNSVIWTGKQLMAVGFGEGGVATSPDGITWTPRASGAEVLTSLSSVVWTGAQFVVVGDWGFIATSSDGISWNKRSAGTLSSLQSVTWTGNLLVAVGSKGTILTSSDGANWNSQQPDTNDWINSVIWTGSQLVAEVSRSRAFLTSQDGVTWIRHFRSVGLGRVKWVHDRWFELPAANGIYASGNGVDWTLEKFPDSCRLYSLTWTGTHYMGLGQAHGNDAVFKSTDAMNWEIHEQQVLNAKSNGKPIPFHLHDVTWAGNQYVAVGDAVVLTSPDGISWTMGVGYPAPRSIDAIAWTGSLLVAVGIGIFASPDGITWTHREAPITGSYSSIVWTGKQLVVTQHSTPDNNTSILTSPDGINWTERHTHLDEQFVTWTGSELVASGEGLETSPDGVTWTVRNSLFGYRHLVWAGNRFVAWGGQVVETDPIISPLGIISSPDGITWTPGGADITYPLASVAWTGQQWMAVGSLGQILTSRDGITWTPRGSPTINALHAVIWANNQLMVVGENGTIITSPDDAALSIASRFGRDQKLSLRQTASALAITLPASMLGLDLEASVYTAQGGKVIETKPAGSPNDFSIPIRQLGTGRYYLEIKKAGRRIAEPFVVLR